MLGVSLSPQKGGKSAEEVKCMQSRHLGGKARGPGVQVHVQQHSLFEASPGYTGPCLKVKGESASDFWGRVLAPGGGEGEGSASAFAQCLAVFDTW